MIWETPGEFSERMGISVQSFYNKRRHAHCPMFPAMRSPSGRLLSLLATPELERFMRLHYSVYRSLKVYATHVAADL